MVFRRTLHDWSMCNRHRRMRALTTPRRNRRAAQITDERLVQATSGWATVRCCCAFRLRTVWLADPRCRGALTALLQDETGHRSLAVELELDGRSASTYCAMRLRVASFGNRPMPPPMLSSTCFVLSGAPLRLHVIGRSKTGRASEMM